MAPDQLSDAVSVLESSGYVRVQRSLNNAPFDFRDVMLTPGGRAEWERARTEARSAQTSPDAAVRPSPQPVGSPFGFTDLDWEWIGQQRQAATLKVCFGHQFESRHYSTDSLTESLRASFQRALDDSEFAGALALDFVSLRAGYGEHLFNDIARTVIASDIAVFETSDRNSNVMIEMGVALTWGTRVFPIREASTEVPPSDISGQTWILYRNSGEVWLDSDHHQSLVQMVNRAGRKKRSSAVARPSGAPSSDVRVLHWESSARAETGPGLVVHNIGQGPVVDIEGQRVTPEGNFDVSRSLGTLNAGERRGISSGWTTTPIPDGALIPSAGHYAARVLWKDPSGAAHGSTWQEIEKR